MVTCFDHFDTYILANDLDIIQLRREVRHADIMDKVNAAWQGTPYADVNPFPWADFAACCREAIEWKQARNRTLPAQTTPGKRINAADIKARTDIVTIIEQYTQLRKSGHNRFTGKCPLHDDHGPSLTVYTDSQTWHCFGACNRGGDIFSFIQAAEHTDFRGAAAILGGT